MSLCLSLSLGLGLDAGAADPNTGPERVAVKQGRLLATVAGKETEPTEEITFPGNIVISTNGTFTVNLGKERTLLEGQVLTQDGTLTSPDGTVAPVVDHIVLKGGRVRMVKDGESTELRTSQFLKDGSRVTPDGMIVARNGSSSRLLDGQLVKLDGSALPVTDSVSLQGGKVVLFKDGSRLELRPGQVMTMADGTKVSADGKLLRPGAAAVRLQEGEVVKIPGVITARR